MKILWFTNTPCGATEKLKTNLHAGGWLKSLEDKLVEQKDIELNICFYWNKELAPFQFNKATYYPILRTSSETKIGRYTNRVFKTMYNDKKETLKLLKVVEIVNPDLIHIHGTEDNFGLIQSYTKIPVVISIQGILSSCSEKFFSGIPFASAYYYEKLTSKLFFRSVLFMHNDIDKRAKRERLILSKANNIIGRTEWDKRITRLLAPRSEYYIGNEILRSSFYEKQWNKEKLGNPVQIVTIMNESLYKGFETIVKTILILSENKSIDFNWTVVGINNSSNLVTVVKRMLGVNINSLPIKLIGNKSETEIVDILLNSDFYCQVSHIENSPNSLCEAMLLGMPIIASYAGGTCSMLENNKEGILVQNGDSYSLAGAILESINNYDKAKLNGSYARDRAIKRHNKDIIVDSLVSTYNHIINRQFIEG